MHIRLKLYHFCQTSSLDKERADAILNFFTKLRMSTRIQNQVSLFLSNTLCLLKFLLTKFLGTAQWPVFSYHNCCSSRRNNDLVNPGAMACMFSHNCWSSRCNNGLCFFISYSVWIWCLRYSSNSDSHVYLLIYLVKILASFNYVSGLLIA